MNESPESAVTSPPRVGERRQVTEVLRSWIVDPTTDPAERAAFADYTTELTARYWPWMGYAIAAAALLWWPLDGLVYAGDPVAPAAMAKMRTVLISVDLCLAFVLPRLSVTPRYAHLIAGTAVAFNLAVAGWTLASLGPGVSSLSLAFVTPQFSVLLLLPLPARVFAAVAFSAVIVGAWAANPASDLHAPGLSGAASFMSFCTALAIGIGHALYLQLRRSFHLRRRVDAQRVALAGLAGRLEQRVSDQTLALRDLHHRAQNVRTEQRQELARDLHDGVGQELTSMRLLVGLGRQLAERDASDGVFDELEGQLDRVQASLRQVLIALRPQMLDERGLVEALRELVLELERRSGLHIELFVDPLLPEPLPAEQSVALYRASQEGLNNALRHARAKAIAIRLTAPKGKVVLNIEDDGVGMPPGRLGAGLGTLSLRERAEALGGEATWASDGGTTLTITLPLPEPP